MKQDKKQAIGEGIVASHRKSHHIPCFLLNQERMAMKLMAMAIMVVMNMVVVIMAMHHEGDNRSLLDHHGDVVEKVNGEHDHVSHVDHDHVSHVDHDHVSHGDHDHVSHGDHDHVSHGDHDHDHVNHDQQTVNHDHIDRENHRENQRDGLNQVHERPGDGVMHPLRGPRGGERKGSRPDKIRVSSSPYHHHIKGMLDREMVSGRSHKHDGDALSALASARPWRGLVDLQDLRCQHCPCLYEDDSKCRLCFICDRNAGDASSPSSPSPSSSSSSSSSTISPAPPSSSSSSSSSVSVPQLVGAPCCSNNTCCFFQF